MIPDGWWTRSFPGILSILVSSTGTEMELESSLLTELSHREEHATLLVVGAGSPGMTPGLI